MCAYNAKTTHSVAKRVHVCVFGGTKERGVIVPLVQRKTNADPSASRRKPTRRTRTRSRVLTSCSWFLCGKYNYLAAAGVINKLYSIGNGSKWWCVCVCVCATSTLQSLCSFQSCTQTNLTPAGPQRIFQSVLLHYYVITTIGQHQDGSIYTDAHWQRRSGSREGRSPGPAQHHGWMWFRRSGKLPDERTAKVAPKFRTASNSWLLEFGFYFFIRWLAGHQKIYDD